MAPLFVAFILAEHWLYRKRHPEWFLTKDTLNNLVLGAINQISDLFFLSINWFFIVGLYQWLFSHGLQWAPLRMNSEWFLILFVTQDFLYYWFHRCSHRVRWFWSAHISHHASEYLNLSTALRQGALYPVTGYLLFYAPLAFVGFSSDWIFFSVAMNLILQFLVHTQAVRRLGPFEWVFNTPSHHRVHHAKNPQYIDKNYAGVFIIWDRTFGTFTDEKDACEFGITHKIEFTSPVESNFKEFIEMWKDFVSARGVGQKTTQLFGPPKSSRHSPKL